MPIAPYAKVLVSVNGAANTSGGLEVASAATIAFSPESTVGWKQSKWEIYDYPEGWATPTGWTLAADGTIYSLSWTPLAFTLPSNAALWGVWMVRLRVNEQVASDASDAPSLLDETTALSLVSPMGLRGHGAREASHFTSSITRLKGWLRSFQRNNQIIETALAAVPTNDGLIPIAMGNADHTVTVPESVFRIVRVTGTFTVPRTLLFGAPASDAAARVRMFLCGHTGDNLVISIGTGPTVIIPPGLNIPLIFEPTGVYEADTGV